MLIKSTFDKLKQKYTVSESIIHFIFPQNSLHFFYKRKEYECVSLYIPTITDGLDGKNNNHFFLWRKLTWVEICIIIFAVVFIKLIVSHIALTLVQTLMVKRKTQKSRCQSSVVWTYENVLYIRTIERSSPKRHKRDEIILKKNFNQTRERSSQQYLLLIMLMTLWWTFFFHCSINSWSFTVFRNVRNTFINKCFI